MLTRIMKPRDDRDAGFTLIELLVVVAIIGILAAIAIPVFLNQRASAYDASVKADLNGIAKVMETVYADTGAYPADETVAEFTDLNPVVSQGNAIVVVTTSNPDAFTIVGCNAGSEKEWTYDSQGGGLSPDPTATDNVCSATAGADGTLAVN
jgi:prepilin-type N-terminal cleavage/methylation domain-containing protein